MWVTLSWMATVFGRLLKFILLVQGRSATKKLKLMIQRRIENPVKHLRGSVL